MKGLPALILIFTILLSSLNLITVAENSEYQSEREEAPIKYPYFIQKTVNSKVQKYFDIDQEQINNLDTGFFNFEKDVLISEDNPNGDDIHPKIIRKGGILVVTYEKSRDNISKTNPICWSQIKGTTWTTQFELDSLIFNLSGIMQSPDIKYVSGIDQFYFSAVDPEAEIYNNVMFWIPGNVTTSEEALGYATSACGRYYYSATGITENWGIAVTTHDGYDLDKIFGVGYFTYPDFESPPVMGGWYYDGNSVHASAPADKLEMDSNNNRIFLVSEQTELGKISIKSTVNDEAMLTNGKMKNGMDKYADIEQWPGEFIANGTDPDVTGSGDMVYVVYAEGDDVKLSYSSCNAGTYDPGFQWKTTTVATCAGFPTVHVMGETIRVGYVKDNNIFMVQSDDYGLTWGDPVQLNDVDGSVVDMPGSVDINDVGILWTDTRNGQKDIYYQLINPDFFIPKITISGGLEITIKIENEGNLSVGDIEISVKLDAPLIFGGRSMETTFSCGPHEMVTFKMSTFGFGKMVIRVECETGDFASASGFLFGPFVWIN